MSDPTITPPPAPDPAHSDAVHALEAEFGELVNRFRRIVTENANRVSEGMLPAAYKVFTTIVRREQITPSALADDLVVDKGQLSRTLRELEGLELISRTPDPTDGRSSILMPTPLGLERLRLAREPQADGLTTALKAWRVEDIHNLTRLLNALTTGAQP